jgi:outer membrane biosynthesis protein TonB
MLFALALPIAFLPAAAVAAAVEPARLIRYSGVPTGSIGYAARTPGIVEMELDINEKGGVTKTRIVRGRADLAPAAVRAVRSWEYASAKVDGRNVKSRMNVILNFEFDSRR